MKGEAVEAAARLLADLRVRAGGCDAPLVALPASCRPETLDEAYRIQEALRARLAARGLGRPVGWKIGCTTPVMQRYLDIPHPCAGTLYEAGLRGSEARLEAADFFQLGLECEIAVRLGSDLAGRAGGHDRGSVAPAVEAVMASVEIVEHRFADFASVGTPSLVADDFFSAGCALGESVAPDRLGALETLTGGFLLDGVSAGEPGHGEAILGHPLNALAWLADHLAARGGRLEAGQVVTLGSVVKTIYPPAGTRVEARFDRLPPVSLRID